MLKSIFILLLFASSVVFAEESFDVRLKAYQNEKSWSKKSNLIVDLCLSSGITHRKQIKQEAIRLLDKSYERKKKDWTTAGKFVLAFIIKDEGKPDQALQLLTECETHLLNGENFTFLAYCLVAKGHCLKLKGLYKESIDAYAKAGEIWKRIENALEYNLSQSLIAGSLIPLKKYDEAEVMLKKCIEELLPFRKFRTLSSYYSNLGELYSMQEKRSLAKLNLEKGVEYALKSKDEGSIARAQNYAAIAEYLGGNVDKSLEKFENALTYRKKVGDVKMVCESHYNIGTVYFETKQLDKAETNFNQSLVFAQKANLLFDQAEALLELSKIQQAKGNNEQAVKYLNQYIAVKEQISNEVTSNRDKDYALLMSVENADATSKLEERETKMKTQLSKERFKTNAFLAGSLVFFGCIVWLFFYKKKKISINSGELDQ
ncbi:MAG: tetratricopeptide repeat protein [Crocinitomicaceae bacterium]